MTHALVRWQSVNLSQGNHKLRLKNVYERENPTVIFIVYENKIIQEI
jgi:hypothetical protein